MELDINLFSSSQIMRDGGQPEGEAAAPASWAVRQKKAGDQPGNALSSLSVHRCTFISSAMGVQEGRSATVLQCNCQRLASGKQRPSRQQRGDSRCQAGSWSRPRQARLQSPPPCKNEPRHKRAAPRREEPLPAKRLRSSAVKNSVTTMPARSAESPPTLRQSGRRPKRATLAPLANGVVPAFCAAESAGSEGCKARTRRLQRAPSHSASKQAAFSRRTGQRRPHEAASARSAEEASPLSVAMQSVSEPASSPDKTAEGPAGTTRRAPLLQQQVGCASVPHAATLFSHVRLSMGFAAVRVNMMLTHFTRSSC